MNTTRRSLTQGLASKVPSGVFVRTATAAVMVVAVAAPATFVATATAPAPAPATLDAATTALPSAGTLTLRTSSTSPAGGSVTWSADSSKVQSISERGTSCTLQSSGDNLLTFSGRLEDSTVTPPGVVAAGRESFRGGSIGVNEGVNNAQCFRVDAGSFAADEILQVSLGTGLRVGNAVPVLAKSATLDIELRANNMVIQAKTFLKDEKGIYQETGKFQLRTGTARASTSPARIADDFTQLSALGTSGHVAWKITPLAANPHFDRIELNALTGSFQLEGGSDAGASPSTFDLVYEADYEVCETDGPYQANGSQSTVTYVGNASGSECVQFGARFTAGDDEVVYLKPRDVNPDAQFIFDITWKRTGSFTPATSIPDVEIDFELGEPNKTPLPFCPKELYVEKVLTGFNTPEGYASFLADNDKFPDFEPATTPTNTPGHFKEYACIDGTEGVRDVDLSATQITVKDKIFVIGDLKMGIR